MQQNHAFDPVSAEIVRREYERIGVPAPHLTEHSLCVLPSFKALNLRAIPHIGGNSDQFKNWPGGRNGLIEDSSKVFNIDDGWETKCVVYGAINKINGHLYVGATKLGMDTRRKRHLYNAKHGRPGKFNNAIRKYGPENFIFVILAKSSDWAFSLREERSLIDGLKPEYNLTEGGEGILGYKFDKETIARCVAARKKDKYPPCPEWLKKANAERARARKGRPCYGRRVPVVCTNGRVFDSGRSAATFYGINAGTVSCLAKTGKRTKNGLGFSKARKP